MDDNKSVLTLKDPDLKVSYNKIRHTICIIRVFKYKDTDLKRIMQYNQAYYNMIRVFYTHKDPALKSIIQ